MKYTGITRPIDDLGRVVLPKELRNSLNINTKDLLEIHIEGDMIILKKSEEKCVLCGSGEDIVSFGGKNLCRACVDGIKNIIP